MRILIVDDEKDQLESLRRGLRTVGYDVKEALNGEEALLILADPQSRIDIILTDYLMPGMNGLDLLKKVRERSRSLPVIMMTAYGEKGLVIDALRNQCDSFIEKPFVLDVLVREIETARLNRLSNTNTHELKETISRLLHQINNPLMSIMGSAQIGVIKLGDTEAAKKGFESIIEATDRIRAINKQVRYLSESDEEKKEIIDGYNDEKIDKIEINRLMEECLAMFRDLITMKMVLLEKDLGGTALYVQGNRDGLEQAFKNLILNAIDSMDGKLLKSLKVKVNVEADEQAPFISICIEDTGCGIPEDALEKVFDPYFTRKKNGTGLGLAVVKEMVERHGGKISVESKVDIGTTFAIYLPLTGPGAIPIKRKPQTRSKDIS